MNTGKLTSIHKLAACLAGLSMLVLSACTALPVNPGNRIASGEAVEVHYTCTLDDGQIVATTERETGEALSEEDREMLFFRDQKKPYVPTICHNTGCFFPPAFSEVFSCSSAFGALKKAESAADSFLKAWVAS